MLAAAGLAVGGCSGNIDDLPRQPITGTVTLDGRLLPTGLIVFTPPGSVAGGAKTSGAASITNGRFSIPRVKGLIPDKYSVAIYPGRTPAEALSPEGRARATFRIPAKYNTQTELEVEISAGGNKELRIDIDSN
jgi:hypothetical protein